jgi:hypothetical protein
MSSLNSKDFTLYLVMSATCQHCVKLKQNYLGKIKSGVEQLGNVHFVPIDLKSMSDQIPSEYPSFLSLYVKWFPTFVLVPTAETQKSKMVGTFKASVFNADYVDNKLTYRNEYPMNDSGIIEWCQRECSRYSNQNHRKILTETESFIPTTVCSKNFKPRRNV